MRAHELAAFLLTLPADAQVAIRDDEGRGFVLLQADHGLNANTDGRLAILAFHDLSFCEADFCDEYGDSSFGDGAE